MKNGNKDSARNSFEKYYIPLIETKDFNALIDKVPFFNQPLKQKQEAYEKPVVEISGSLLDHLYHQKYSNFIGINLSKQMEVFLNKLILQD